MEDFDIFLVIVVISLFIIFINLIYKISRFKEPREEVYVYIIENTYSHDTKIGISNNPEKRIKQLQTGSSRLLKIQYTILFNTRNEAIKAENSLHKKYSKYRLMGEWFEVDYKKVIKFVSEKYRSK